MLKKRGKRTLSPTNAAATPNGKLEAKKRTLDGRIECRITIPLANTIDIVVVVHKKAESLKK